MENAFEILIGQGVIGALCVLLIIDRMRIEKQKREDEKIAREDKDKEIARIKEVSENYRTAMIEMVKVNEGFKNELALLRVGSRSRSDDRIPAQK